MNIDKSGYHSVFGQVDFRRAGGERVNDLRNAIFLHDDVGVSQDLALPIKRRRCFEDDGGALGKSRG